jgi:hypothetical protein
MLEVNVKYILPKLIIFYMQISEQNNNLQLIWISNGLKNLGALQTFLNKKQHFS